MKQVHVLVLLAAFCASAASAATFPIKYKGDDYGAPCDVTIQSIGHHSEEQTLENRYADIVTSYVYDGKTYQYSTRVFHSQFQESFFHGPTNGFTATNDHYIQIHLPEFFYLENPPYNGGFYQITFLFDDSNTYATSICQNLIRQE